MENLKHPISVIKQFRYNMEARFIDSLTFLTPTVMKIQ